MKYDPFVKTFAASLLQKGSENQERDERGRFAGGGGFGPSGEDSSMEEAVESHAIMGDKHIEMAEIHAESGNKQAEKDHRAAAKAHERAMNANATGNEKQAREATAKANAATERANRHGEPQ